MGAEGSHMVRVETCQDKEHHMNNGMEYALTKDDPKMVGAIEHNGICWPGPDLDRLRQIARETGKPGIRRLKTRKIVWRV